MPTSITRHTLPVEETNTTDTLPYVIMIHPGCEVVMDRKLRVIAHRRRDTAGVWDQAVPGWNDKAVPNGNPHSAKRRYLYRDGASPAVRHMMAAAVWHAWETYADLYTPGAIVDSVVTAPTKKEKSHAHA